MDRQLFDLSGLFGDGRLWSCHEVLHHCHSGIHQRRRGGLGLPLERLMRHTPDQERERLSRGIAPMWASAWGEDEYGVFASFEVAGVEQRMRWIAPGIFVMGSPQTEPGRDDDEGPRHMVTLTHGYWLADTPCTQALWEVAMGDNPSQFRSPRRPVEKVSWEDVQNFIEKLNERVAGLLADLPTEAQWEYACRAGTSTATYAGPIEIYGANNAPVLDVIAWYGGNSGMDFDLDDGWDSSGWPDKQYMHQEAGTRDVALKKPNAWGLYDMLGNVYEWCADVARDYAVQLRADSFSASGPSRVHRGGGWNSYARHVRAANRGWRVSSSRYDDLGFRLARGQDLRQVNPRG
ncbi:MAG: formylglycine-generating enzyme family protein [Myxococcota bacterium]